MIKLEKEQTARFAARLEQETQESVMRDIAQFSEADIVDTWASEPPACAEVHAMVFNMERGVHIDEAIEALREAGFEAADIDYAATFSEAERRLYALPKDHIYVVYKH